VHTPGAQLVVEQIIRPTGLLDPKITLKPLKNQIDETIELCRQRVEKGERVLVTTLTKRTAEDLADYLRDVGLKVRYCIVISMQSREWKFCADCAQRISTFSWVSICSEKVSIFPKFRWYAFWTPTRKVFCAARLLLFKPQVARHDM
jgi:hypothetical protein